MFKTQSTVETLEASRLVRRLCKHWGHKFAVNFDEQRGHIDFGDAVCTLEATPIALVVTLQATEESLQALETVVEDHLQRFVAADQPLVFVWQHSSESQPEQERVQ